VEVAESPSWRFAESVEQQLLLALWVRDALRLEIRHGPPRLASKVPDRREHLQGSASDQWLQWWRTLVEEAVLRNDGRANAHRRPREQPVADGPLGLVEGPDLRETLAALLPEGLAGANLLQRAATLPAGRPAFAWQVVREVAEDVAFDHAVELDRVRGVALVLPVEGLWWQLAGPGAVLCSAAATADPLTGRVALSAAFESELEN
jgi:hypothetical protein